MSSPGEALDKFADAEGVNVHSVAMERRITPLKDLLSLARMVRTIRSIRPHIVHASTPKGGLLGTLAARLARVPAVIYHVRGLPFTEAGGATRRLLKTTERISTRLADRILCVSESVSEELVESGIAAPEKTVVLRSGSSNGVDSEVRFNPERLPANTRSQVRERLRIFDGAIVVGFVGRLCRDKGIEELAAAWRTVSESRPNAWLLIVGPWDERDGVTPPTRHFLESHHRVRVAGEQDEIAQYYAAMDLLALPTFREGFPNVVLEAGAMRLPVIATRVTGCVDAVRDGTTGVLVAPHDVAALASAIMRYVDDAALRGEHGAAGRQRAIDEFNPRKIWSALRDEYLALLRARNISIPDNAATKA
jgi:glycosyltransferase involved in cell wall biosynthesis